ncbi:MAG: leucine-rich repeat domain-containing protein [Planctomycetota bacterium]
MAKRKTTSRSRKKAADPKTPGTRLPRFTILPDHPITAAQDDQAIGFEARLSSVLDIIRHRQTLCPMAIAIYGDWGTGKTSAMKWLERQLNEWNKLDHAERDFFHGVRKKTAPHPRVYSVWFEPWKFHKREDVWRGLIAEVILHCISASNLDLENAGRRLRDTASRFGKFLGRSFLDALSRIKFRATAKGDATGVGADAGVEVSGEMFRDVVDEFHKVNHPERAYLNDFEVTLKDWVGKYLRPADGDPNKEELDAVDYAGDRMVIFIDDLDRCLPEVTLEVLEALKLYLNIPQLIFVVGLDRAVVDAVVRNHYAAFEPKAEKKDSGEGIDWERERVLIQKSEKYLDKMFQVEIDITPSVERAREFATQQISRLDKATGKFWSRMLPDGSPYRLAIEEVVGYLAENNPREIKRLLNSTLMRATEAADDVRLRENPVVDQYADREVALNAEDAKRLRFAQGAQVFLIQRVVKREFGSRIGNPFFDFQSRQFFEHWRDFVFANPDEDVCDYPLTEFKRHPTFSDWHGDDTYASEGKSAKPALESRHEGGGQTEDNDFPNLVTEFERKWGKSNLGLLLASNAIWRLMKIPYDHSVAETAPLESTDSVTRKRSRIRFEKFSPEIKELIAAALGITVEELADNPDRIFEVTRLNLTGTQVSDAGPLAGLTALKTLYLGGTQVSDAGPLAALTALERLDLIATQVSDAGPLAGLTALKTLDLSGTQVSDAGPLAALTALERLYLTGTQVSDAGPLAGLTALKNLYLRETQVSDAGPLAALTALERLYLSGTQVSDAGPLAALTVLKTLDLSGTQVSDAGPLAGLTALKNLYLRETQVSDAGPLAALTALKTLDLSGTQVSDAGPLAGLTALTHLDLIATQVSDAGPLTALTALTHLDLTGTQVSDFELLKNLPEKCRIILPDGSKFKRT